MKEVLQLELLAIFSLLSCTLVAGHFLHRYKIVVIPDSIVSILLGGIYAVIFHYVPYLPSSLEFGETFFLVLLPFLIFESGFSVHKKMLFRNIGSILTYAIFGTFISAFMIGGLVFGITRTMQKSNGYTFLDTMVLGSILSSTDPVATLAIFGKYKVDTNTYGLVLGESMLNDAVSIVLFNTLVNFYDVKLTYSSFFLGIGKFLFVFIGSTLIGLLMAAFISLIFKKTSLGNDSPLEFIFVIEGAYASYFFPDVFKMSGIVSIFFYGLNTRHYTFYVLSHISKESMKWSFNAIKHICETLVFCLLGITLENYEAYNIPLIAVTFFSLLVARFVQVVFLSALLNTRRRNKITWSVQLILWNAGLRGAIAYALAVSPLLSATGINREIVTTVHLVVLITIFFHGLLTIPILKLTEPYLNMNLESESREIHQKIHSWWSHLDKLYIIPFISNPRNSNNQEDIPDQRYVENDESELDYTTENERTLSTPELELS